MIYLCNWALSLGNKLPFLYYYLEDIMLPPSSAGAHIKVCRSPIYNSYLIGLVATWQWHLYCIKGICYMTLTCVTSTCLIRICKKQTRGLVSMGAVKRNDTIKNHFSYRYDISLLSSDQHCFLAPDIRSKVEEENWK